LDQARRKDLIDYFRYFADHHAFQLSPLYAKFSHHIADSDYLLNLANKATFGQPAANLIFAAVQYLLADKYQNDPLAEYYDTLGGNRSDDEGDPCVLFEAFIRAHEDVLLSLISTRITNTNEIGRCAILLPALMAVEAEAQAPLHLVEIGPSCGLVLCWDKYSYDFGDTHIGPDDAAVKLTTDVKGPPPPLNDTFPIVASRVGLDLHPSDINDPDTLAWQLALIWPGGKDRAERISKAFDVVRAVQPRIIGGDAVETIADVIENLPGNGAVCVHHSFATYQIPPDRRQVLSDTLAELGRQRPIWRIGIEWIDDGGRGLKQGDNTVGIARYRDGKREFQAMGFCHSHGRWIEWEPQVPQPTDVL